MTSRRLLLLLSTLLFACTPSSADTTGSEKNDTSAADSGDTSAALAGCQDWANWTCEEQSGGCAATCEDNDIACNGSGDCRSRDDDSSCPAQTGEGCALCEAAIAECAATWGY